MNRLTANQSDEPLKHLHRDMPPWTTQAEAVTECGRPMSDVAAHSTYDEAAAFIAKHGKRRAAFAFCQTCMERTRYRADWINHPEEIVSRWVAGHSQWNREPDPARPTVRHIHALAALVAAHPQEYAALITPDPDVTDLRTVRHRKATR